MNLLHLSEKFELNNLEKQIVQYMQDHLSELKSIGIRQMAKDNYTSTSTIYKLCNKFGFDGYSDMIYHLTSAKDITINFKENYLEYKDAFTSLVCDKSKRIIVFGFGFSAPIAEYMQQRFILLGYQALSVVHMEMFNGVINDNTVCIIVSYSGQTPRLNELAEQAHQNHIPIISFIANQQSPIYQYSAIPILIGEYNSFVHEMNKANTFFGETLIAFETLLFD